MVTWCAAEEHLRNHVIDGAHLDINERSRPSGGGGDAEKLRRARIGEGRRHPFGAQRIPKGGYFEGDGYLTRRMGGCGAA